MKLAFAIATEIDAPAIARIATAADRHLMEKHGLVSSKAPVAEKSVLRSIRTSRVLTAVFQQEIIAALSLSEKKPWAIDPAYFTNVRRSLYLTNMVVSPGWQRRGVGSQILNYARTIAQDWPADAIRLDAYDNETGAGGFYAKCGYREVGRAIYRKTPLIYFELLL